jgi:hypothetical protein
MSNRFIGYLFMTFTYLIAIIQICAIYKISMIDAIYLPLFKNMFYISAILAILSHLRVAITDAGKITHENNLDFIDFYTRTRKIAMLRADKFNKDGLNKGLINAPDEFNDEEDDNSDIEYDENEYPESLISVEKVKSLSETVCIEKCRKCKVYKLPETNHCYICEGYSID